MSGTTELDAPKLSAAVEALLAQSRHVETACGQGVMVWRYWGEGKPVILLHGGSGSWTHWIRNIPALLACGRQVWAPDLPGFGDSSTPSGGGDADAVIGPLALGLREVLGPGPHEIAAFSFGSLVAALFAAQHPDMVVRLLLVGLPVLPLHHGRGVALPPIRTTITPEDHAAGHFAILAAIMFHKASCIDSDTVALQAANVVKDRMRSRKLVTTAACALAVRALQCQFECIWGAEDVLYRERWAEVQTACEASLHCTRITLIPDAGHWVQYERPEAFNQSLITWATQT